MHTEILQPKVEQKKATICIGTYGGGSLDHEFILGSICHHAAMADQVVVLDVAEIKDRKTYKNLPANVRWVQEDGFGQGTDKFAYVPAVRRLIELGKESGCDVFGWADSDEFFIKEAKDTVFQLAKGNCVETRIATWCSDGHCRYRPESYTRRIWDMSMDVKIPQNTSWQKSEHYDGNPNRHPIVKWPPNQTPIRTKSIVHHHVHWTFPEKGLHPFGEWPYHPTITEQDDFSCWPELLRRWRVSKILPSEAFK